jgi:hypothetical protein
MHAKILLGWMPSGIVFSEPFVTFVSFVVRQFLPTS